MTVALSGSHRVTAGASDMGGRVEEAHDTGAVRVGRPPLVNKPIRSTPYKTITPHCTALCTLCGSTSHRFEQLQKKIELANKSYLSKQNLV